MLFRTWHGWTDPSAADAYERLLDGEIVPAITARGIDGLHHVDILRREAGTEIEFVTIMAFDDWDAVEAFAGDPPTASVVPPAARRLLARFDAHSRHYQLVARHTPSCADRRPPPPSTELRAAS